MNPFARISLLAQKLMPGMNSLSRIPRLIQVLWLGAIYGALIYFFLAREMAWEPSALVTRTTLFGLVLVSIPLFLVSARDPLDDEGRRARREHRESRLQSQLTKRDAHVANAEAGSEDLRDLPSVAERRGTAPINRWAIFRMLFGVLWAVLWLWAAWEFSRPGMGVKNHFGSMIMFCMSAVPFLLSLGESAPDSTRHERRMRRSWRLKERVKGLGRVPGGGV
jgi:hypothetical protein